MLMSGRTDNQCLWGSHKTFLSPSPVERLSVSNKLKCYAVVAIAQARWFRAVFKNMSLVAAAAGAVIFGARDNQLIIRFGFHMSGDRIVKARPAGAAVEFIFRWKERQRATGAGECARVL